MKNKILSLVFSFVLVFGSAFFSGVQNVSAQFTASFPIGCTSALGYSIANGLPCNGTSVATMNVAGCATALGYSVTNGAPCSGSSVAIAFLAGCSSVYGYSTVGGMPCNGTSVASTVFVPTPSVPTPGLPATGASPILLNILLSTAGFLAVAGSLYVAKKRKAIN